MLERIEKLESKRKEVQARISQSAFQQWLASNTTKSLLLLLEIDAEAIKDAWSNDLLGSKEPEAKGAIEYINSLHEGLRELGGDFHDED